MGFNSEFKGLIKQCVWVYNIYIYIYIYKGTQWRSWLRHCATSRKAVGSIPDGVLEIFHRHGPSGRTMALRSTQALTEMSTRNFLGVKGG